jgi:exosortase
MNRVGVRLPSTGGLLILVGVAALVIPTLLNLASGYWSTSNGAHGPIILVSGLWLLLRQPEEIRFQPRSISSAWLLLCVPLCLLMLYGRIFGILGVESAAVYLLLVLLACFYWGIATVSRRWVAFAYLAFLIKPPEMLVAELTQPLKIMISQWATALLQAFDYPIAASGVLIQIGQYELLVQQACAGLGSLVTLLAMGLIYVHLVRPSERWHSLLLLAAIIPIALAANLIRVLTLVLLTYHVGDGVAQSFAHDAAGLLTFLLSMAGMLAVDGMFQRRQRGVQS